METKKRVNFTQREKETLLFAVAKYKHIVEDKSTKAFMVDKKKQIWEQIEIDYNCSAETGSRNAKQLKVLYENLKRETRKHLPEPHVLHNADSNDPSGSQSTDYYETSAQSLEMNQSSCGQSINQTRSTDRTEEHMASKRQRINSQKKLLDTAQKLLTTSRTDEWEIIGKSIGLQLKDLSKRQQIIVQKLISDAIYYGKLEKLTEESSISLGSPVAQHTNPPKPFEAQFLPHFEVREKNPIESRSKVDHIKEEVDVEDCDMSSHTSSDSRSVKTEIPDLLADDSLSKSSCSSQHHVAT